VWSAKTQSTNLSAKMPWEDTEYKAERDMTRLQCAAISAPTGSRSDRFIPRSKAKYYSVLTTLTSTIASLYLWSVY
jgi:hypothetical protein